MKITHTKLAALTTLSVSLFFCTGSYALPFSITPTAGTTFPTTIIPGQITKAFYSVSNQTGSLRPSNYLKYLPPNVSQITVDPAYPNLCGARFSLNAKGNSGDTCTLELLINGAVNGSDPDPHHHLFACFPGGTTCAGTPTPLNVTAIMPATYTFSYIGNFSTNLVSLCSINTSNGSFFGCQNSAGDSSVVFDFPGDIAINNADTLAYVANFGGGSGILIYVCNISPTTKKLSNCVISDGGGTFVAPLGVTLDPANKHFYAASIGSNNVSLCNVNSVNGQLSGCVLTGDLTFNAPIDVEFNAAGTRGYVSNTGNGTISLCSVNTTTGVLSGCGNSAGDGSAVFNGPALMSITASGTRLYVSENGSGSGTSVATCSINAVTGQLYACTDSGVGPIFQSPVSVTLNAANTQIYISNNASTTVTVCMINATSGLLSGCTDSTGIFAGPTGVALQ